MDNFQQTLELEIMMQSQILKRSLQVLADAPKGRLFVRERLKSTAYYQIEKEKTSAGWKNIQRNITGNPDMILSLTEKALAEQTMKACKNNLALLQNALSKYKPYQMDELTGSLPRKYQEVLALRREKQMEDWLIAPYEKCPFDPQKHIHETAYGELVRSKSEVIIANALFSYGIPFHYEEQFPRPNENGDFYYPDFTILLPNGLKLIWEHLGLLSELAYCIDNAQKLHSYQQNQVVIGKTLILTQDDYLGNCSSAFTHHIIEQYLLPQFAGIKLEPGRIKDAASFHRG